MKTILALSILFSLAASPALGELTDADLNQIRLIVNDAIDASEKRFDEKIQASETRMKEHITQQVDSLKTPVAWLIGILVAVIALIGIPLVVLTIMIGWRSIKDNSQEKINQELREEIETPKQQQIVRPWKAHVPLTTTKSAESPPVSPAPLKRAIAGSS